MLSSSLLLTSTGRELFPIFTQSSLKLGLVSMYSCHISCLFLSYLKPRELHSGRGLCLINLKCIVQTMRRSFERYFLHIESVT